MPETPQFSDMVLTWPVVRPLKFASSSILRKGFRLVNHGNGVLDRFTGRTSGIEIESAARHAAAVLSSEGANNYQRITGTSEKNISTENPPESGNPCFCAPPVRYVGSNGKAKDGLAGDGRSGVLAAPSKRAREEDYQCTGSDIPMLARISSTAVFFPVKRFSVIWRDACLPWSSEIMRAKR